MLAVASVSLSKRSFSSLALRSSLSLNRVVICDFNILATALASSSNMRLDFAISNATSSALSA